MYIGVNANYTFVAPSMPNHYYYISENVIVNLDNTIHNASIIN